YFDLGRVSTEHRETNSLATDHPEAPTTYDATYWLDQCPIRDHEVIAGHAVRAAYLMSGAVDVASETGDDGLLRMVHRVWRNTTERNMYVTGGIGPSAANEGFTVDYDLPNDTAY